MKNLARHIIEISIILYIVFLLRPLYKNIAEPIMALTLVCCMVFLFLKITMRQKIEFNFNFLKKILTHFSIKKEYNIKLLHLAPLPIAASLIAANALFVAFSYRNTAGLKYNLLIHEYNIIEKIFSIYIFYALFTLLFYAFGQKLLSLLNINLKTRLEGFIFSIGVGLVPFIFSIFLITTLEFLYSWAVWIILFIIFIFSFKEIKSILHKIKKYKITILPYDKLSILKNTIFFFVIISLSLSFVFIIKPVAIDADSLNMYFNAPVIYVDHHKYIPINTTGIMGQNNEMLYAGILSITDTVFIAHFQLMFFILCIIVFYLLAKKLFSEKYALLSIITIYFIPWNFYFIHTNKVEMFLSFYLSLILFSLFLWKENMQNKKILYLIGIFSGIAMGIKYTAILLIAPVYLIVLLILIQKKQVRLLLGPVVLSVLLSILLFYPWAIKNQIYFDSPNPITIQNKTSSFGCDKDFKKTIRDEVSHLNFGKSDDKLIDLIFIKTIIEQSTKIGTDSNLMNFFSIGPVIIFLLFFIFFRKKNISTIFFITAIYFALWHLLPFGGRPWYAFFGVYLAYFLLPYILLKYKKIFIFYILIILPLNMQYSLNSPGKPMEYLIGSQDKKEYIKKNVHIYNASNYINNLKLKDSDKVLQVGDNGSFPIKNNHKILIRDLYLTKTGCALYNDNGENYYKTLKNNQVKYIVTGTKFSNTNYDKHMSKSIAGEKTNDNIKIYESLARFFIFSKNYTEQVYIDDTHIIYRLK